MTENWHIRYICNTLQREAERIAQRRPRRKHLIINVPPRTLKSELVNVFFSVYLWILDDSLKFISTSYSYRLSESLSVQARRIIESDWFKNLYPHIEINKDENAKVKYTTKKGGLRYCTSTGGTVTGMGADVIVIDDPQNPQEARSDVKREKANAYFNETLRSRLNDSDVGMFIVIMQRLHEEDLTGMLLELEPSKWKHICLPAEQTTNVFPSVLTNFYSDLVLFPQRLSKNVLESFKIGLGSYGYSGQYLQSPSPADGGMLKRDWFKIEETPKDKNGNPVNLRWDFFLDTAYTDKTYNDATAMMAATYYDNKIYIRKIEAVRLEFPELIKKIQEFVHENGYTQSSRIFIEPKASGKSISQQLRRETGLNVIEDKPPTQDKVSRVNGISAIVEAGRVILIDGRYIDSFLNECVAFPNGTNDDQIDTLVMCVDKYTTRANSVQAFAI